MFVDLTQKVTQFVVQEYLNKIVNARTNEELSFDTHKLVHTFEVVKMAQELIDQTEEKINEATITQILNGAVLHDIARCYEFKDGKKLKEFDHGTAGAGLIQHQFPELLVEQKTTELHNKLPSESDPKEVKFVLDYVRDSDILGNIRYQNYHMDLFIYHMRDYCPREYDTAFISEDIIQNIKLRSIRPTPKGRVSNLLDMILHELTWIFILKTKAAFILSKKQNLFVKYRDAVIQTVLPILNVTESEKQHLKQDILTLFPNSLFEEEFKKHGI